MRRRRAIPAFCIKLAIGADLAMQVREAGLVFWAVAADSVLDRQDGIRAELAETRLPIVMVLKPRRRDWAHNADVRAQVDVARDLAWHDQDDRGNWCLVLRTFLDGTPIPGGRLARSWAGEAARRLVPGGGYCRPEDHAGQGHSAPGRPTSPGPASPARPVARIQRPTWPRSCGSMRSATRSSRATGQGRAGLGRLPDPLRHHRRSEPVPGSTTRSACGGLSGSPITRRSMTRHRSPSPVAKGAALRTAAATVPAAGATRGTRLAFLLDHAPELVADMKGAPPRPGRCFDQLGHGRLWPAPTPLIHKLLLASVEGPDRVWSAPKVTARWHGAKSKRT